MRNTWFRPVAFFFACAIAVISPPSAHACFGTADMNLDGELDGSDIQGFVFCLTGVGPVNPNCPCGDMNRNGVVTMLDVPAFVNVLLQGGTGCVTDLAIDSDNDGFVLADLADDDSIEGAAPGKYIVVNTDDDNNDGTPDKSDGGATIGENDLVPIVLCGACDVPAARRWRLTYPAQVKVWTAATRTGHIATGALNMLPVPATLYVEGLAHSAAQGNIQIVLEMTNVAATVIFASDSVKATAVQVDIDVDTDRNGATDDADEKKKGEWTKDRGAIFMVNCDDDNADAKTDCADFDNAGEPINANEDTVINGANDVHDVANLIIRKPGDKTGLQFFLRMTADDLKAVHIFEERAANKNALWGGWAANGGAAGMVEKHISAFVDAANDKDLGIENLFLNGQVHPKPGGGNYTFDGEVDVEYIVQRTVGAVAIDNTKIVKTDMVRLKVAPYLMLSNNQDAQEVWHCNDAGAGDIAAKFGALSNTYVYVLGGAEDQWGQDHIQIGYTEMPKPGGGGARQSMHLTLRMPRGVNQPAWPETKLFGADKGLYRLNSTFAGVSSGDFGGNLEQCPYSDVWPLGRMVIGNSMHATTSNLLNSQKMAGADALQKTVTIDTNWLIVKHVDEVVSFLPGGGRGYKVLVSSPAYGESLLRNGDAGRGIAAPADENAVFGVDQEASGTSSTAVTTTNKVYLFDGVAHGRITCVTVANLVDGEKVTVSDGAVAKDFEFDTNGAVAGGSVQVDISTDVTATNVRNRLRIAINGVGGGYNVFAEIDGADSLVVINKDFGAAGNVAIAETVANGGFTVLGMVGGEAGGNGRDFSLVAWKYIRIYDGTGKGQVGEIKDKGKGWVHVMPAVPGTPTVWNTTSKVVWDTMTPADGVFKYAMGGSPVPVTDKWGAEPDNTSKYIIVKDSRKWRDGAATYFPAVISVKELKADALLWTLNGKAQDKTANDADANSAKRLIQAAMGNAAGGGDYLRRDGDITDDSLAGDANDDFIAAPEIYFGPWNGGPNLVAGSNGAYLPGLANVQPATAALFVFPASFGTPTGAANDVYEKAITAIIGAAAEYADDWDLYHRLIGEVHCGTEVKRELYGFKWWERQP